MDRPKSSPVLEVSRSNSVTNKRLQQVSSSLSQSLVDMTKQLLNWPRFGVPVNSAEEEIEPKIELPEYSLAKAQWTPKWPDNFAEENSLSKKESIEHSVELSEYSLANAQWTPKWPDDFSDSTISEETDRSGQSDAEDSNQSIQSDESLRYRASTHQDIQTDTDLSDAKNTHQNVISCAYISDEENTFQNVQNNADLSNQEHEYRILDSNTDTNDQENTSQSGQSDADLEGQEDSHSSVQSYAGLSKQEYKYQNDQNDTHLSDQEDTLSRVQNDRDLSDQEDTLSRVQNDRDLSDQEDMHSSVQSYTVLSNQEDKHQNVQNDTDLSDQEDAQQNVSNDECIKDLADDCQSDKNNLYLPDKKNLDKKNFKSRSKVSFDTTEHWETAEEIDKETESESSEIIKLELPSRLEVDDMPTCKSSWTECNDDQEDFVSLVYEIASCIDSSTDADEDITDEKKWFVDLGNNRNYIKALINYDQNNYLAKDIKNEKDIEKTKLNQKFKWSINYDNLNYVRSLLRPDVFERILKGDLFKQKEPSKQRISLRNYL